MERLAEMTISLLVINPNSSQKISDNLERIIAKPEGVLLDFYTAPEEAPAEINGTETSIESETVVLQDLKENKLHENYDGFLVCCYSNHPLIRSLGKLTPKPILGIMQGTLLYALLNPAVTKLFILTSVSSWEPLLDQGIMDFVGASEFPKGKFERTKALDVSVLNLNDSDEYAKIVARLTGILETEYKHLGIDCVLLGCAGMAGLDRKLAATFPQIKFVDCITISIELLLSLVNFNMKYS